MNSHVIAVWGTLKKGRFNHNHFLDQAKYLGEDLLKDLNDNHTSTAINRNPAGLAKVELYEVSDNEYKAIDDMENLFDYTGINTKLESGIMATVWYHKNQLPASNNK